MDTPRTTAALKLSPYLLSLLRITIGMVFIRHGMQLLFGFPFGGKNHDFTTLAGIGGVLGFVGGIFVIVGLFTRPVTFFLSGMMAVAFFADAVPKSGTLWTLREGEAAVFYCFAYLFMSAAGAGVLSLDHLIWHKDGAPYPFRSAKWTPYLLSLMRFMIGYMYIQHGTEKLWGYPSGRADHNFSSLHGFAGLLEFPGAILMLLGLFVRPASFILSGQMAVAYWARWAPRGFWRSLIVGEASIYFCFAYLLMSAIGGGPFSLDHAFSTVFKGRRERSKPGKNPQSVFSINRT
jgi:putative oxidoreductase